MTEKDIELAIYRIKDFNTKKLAATLHLSLVQARNIKRGASAISNINALMLKEKFDLEPEAFAQIHKQFLEKKGNKI